MRDGFLTDLIPIKMEFQLSGGNRMRKIIKAKTEHELRKTLNSIRNWAPISEIKQFGNSFEMLVEYRKDESE
jgi:hypothetical protein